MSCPPGRPSEYIEHTFLDILSEIEKRPFGEPSITLKRIVTNGTSLSPEIKEREVTYRWPGKNKGEAWRFCTTELEPPRQEGLCI